MRVGFILKNVRLPKNAKSGSQFQLAFVSNIFGEHIHFFYFIFVSMKYNHQGVANFVCLISRFFVKKKLVFEDMILQKEMSNYLFSELNNILSKEKEAFISA